MLAFDRLLRRLYAAADELRLDGDAFFHAQALQQLRDPLFGEDAHQVIFKREVEARGAGIALAAGASAKLVIDAARLVAFGAQNVQAADGGDLVVLFISLRFVAAECFGPLVSRDGVFIAVVVENRNRAVFLRTLNLALSHAQLLGDSFLHHLLLGHEFGIATEQNVGTAARHVGSDGDHALAAGLGHKFSFALVEFGVQYNVLLEAFLLQQIRKPLGFFYRCGAHQYGLAFLGQLLNLVGDGKVFFLLRTKNDVGILQPQHLLVGGNDGHFQLINFVKLGCFRFRSAGHARELLEHAEVILEGDGGERLVLALDLDAFLGLDRLVKAVRPASAGHHAPGKVVDNDDFAVFHHVLHVAAIERVRLDRGFDVMLERPVLRIGDVADAEQALDFPPALVGDRDVAVLFVDHKVTGELRRFAGSYLKFLAFL